MTPEELHDLNEAQRYVYLTAKSLSTGFDHGVKTVLNVLKDLEELGLAELKLNNLGSTLLLETLKKAKDAYLKDFIDHIKNEAEDFNKAATTPQEPSTEGRETDTEPKE